MVPNFEIKLRKKEAPNLPFLSCLTLLIWKRKKERNFSLPILFTSTKIILPIATDHQSPNDESSFPLKRYARIFHPVPIKTYYFPTVLGPRFIPQRCHRESPTSEYRTTDLFARLSFLPFVPNRSPLATAPILIPIHVHGFAFTESSRVSRGRAFSRLYALIREPLPYVTPGSVSTEAERGREITRLARKLPRVRELTTFYLTRKWPLKPPECTYVQRASWSKWERSRELEALMKIYNADYRECKFSSMHNATQIL